MNNLPEELLDLIGNASDEMLSYFTADDIPYYFVACDIHDKKFDKSYRALGERFKNLPNRNQISDEENTKNDKARVELIIDMLQYLDIYQKVIKVMIKTESNHSIRKFLDCLSVRLKRNCLAAVCQSIYSLSGDFRGAYKGYLTLAPFTWETFEHLGAFVATEHRKNLRFFYHPDNHEVVNQILLERCNRELVVEAGVEVIIDEDLVKMIDFFKQLHAHRFQGHHSLVITPAQFFSIKAITKRTMDIDTLGKLINLTTNEKLNKTEIESMPKTKEKKKSFSPTLVFYRQSVTERYTAVDSKFKQHAALRRLEMIGELLTGKYFSVEWKSLDDTIDWEAFNVLRDGIAHQDEGQNYIKTQKLLDDKSLMSELLKVDLPEFHLRLEGLCEKYLNTKIRYKAGTEAQMCQGLLEHEQELYGIALSLQLPRQAPKSKDEQPKVKLTKEQRAQRREDEQKAAAARHQAIESSYVGLTSIRKAKQLYSDQGSSSNPVLNPRKRVEIALEALKNIREFLSNEAKLNIRSHTQMERILEAFDENEFLFDAINYNLEQFLQFLDKIKVYEPIKDSPLIAEYYDQFRYLRNHLAHGAMLLDLDYFDHKKLPEKYTNQQKKVAKVIGVLMLHFIPLLEQAIIKIDAEEAKKNAASGSSSRPKI